MVGGAVTGGPVMALPPPKKPPYPPPGGPSNGGGWTPSDLHNSVVLIYLEVLKSPIFYCNYKRWSMSLW